MNEVYDVRRWDWEREPDASRTWPEAARRLVVCEPGLLTAPVTTLNETGIAADEGAWLVSDCLEILNRRERLIPALYARTQADLERRKCEACDGRGWTRDCHPSTVSVKCWTCSGSGTLDGVRALLAVRGERRALVCSPREAIDLGGVLAEERSVYRGDETSGFIDHELAIDLLVIMGEVGPEARPMHPKHVRSLVEQGRAASVPVVFAGWGEWVPRSQRAVSERDRLTLPTSPLGGDDFGVRVGADRSGALFDGAEVRDPIPWLGVAS